MKLIWLDTAVFSWQRQIFGTAWPVGRDTRRPYEYLTYAESLLANSPSEMQRSDALANAKRALNQRLQVLDARYKISSLPLPIREKGLLQRLEALGVLRPFILRQLLDIRNRIEHRDAAPPPTRRCGELLDFVWYFLRSTDLLANAIYTDGPFTRLDGRGHETQHGFELSVVFRAKVPRVGISGWFPGSMLSNAEGPSLVPVRYKALHGPELWHAKNDHLDKDLTDRWLSGSLQPSPAHTLLLFRTLLNVTNA